MERLVINADLLEKLLHLKQPAELVDAEGHLVAVVEPLFDATRYEIVGDEPNAEEIERRLKTDRRIPANEVVPHLRKLA